MNEVTKLYIILKNYLLFNFSVSLQGIEFLVLNIKSKIAAFIVIFDANFKHFEILKIKKQLNMSILSDYDDALSMV